MDKKSITDFWKSIALTGFIVGTLDILAAFLMYFMSSGNGPMNVLLYIASAAFGGKAFSGGVPMALVGLLFHFIIAFGFTFLLFKAYPGVNKFVKNQFLQAVLFGLVIWVIMNLIVLPLSSVPKGAFDLVGAIKGAVVLILAVGVPISMGARNYYAEK